MTEPRKSRAPRQSSALAAGRIAPRSVVLMIRWNGLASDTGDPKDGALHRKRDRPSELANEVDGGPCRSIASRRSATLPSIPSWKAPTPRVVKCGASSLRIRV